MFAKRNTKRAALTLAATIQFAAAASAAEYQIIDLGPLDGGVGSAALGINEKGDAVGVSYVNRNGNIANSLPVRWNAGGGVDKLWEGDGVIYCWWDEVRLQPHPAVPWRHPAGRPRLYRRAGPDQSV
jgi:hypothetical protein